MSEDHYINGPQVLLDDDPYTLKVRMAWDEKLITEEELKHILESHWQHRFYHELLFGREETKFEKEFPPIKPWSPYTELHDKIDGWLND